MCPTAWTEEVALRGAPGRLPGMDPLVLESRDAAVGPSSVVAADDERSG
jgi:hypothetical protein